MKRWWSDTLFKRLFVLMWVALVLSHLAAFEVVMQVVGGWRSGFSIANTPTLPSLPPMPWLSGERGPPMRPPGEAFGGPPGSPPGEPPGHPPAEGTMRRGLPPAILVLDYGVRLLLIGVAAWFGARWLAAPVRRLVDASHAFTGSIGRDAPLPTLDEARGTVEVREAARVFNGMARQLDEQFKGRGLLMAAISHDLRTPLTRMRMRLEGMEPQAAAERCAADVREMNELIDSALEVFRGAGHAEPAQSTDVHALVQALCDDLVEQGHAVSMRGGAAVVDAKPAALRRALSNLLSNALRYGERAEVGLVFDAAGLCIVIDDRGPGIPADQLEAVFQPFYRLESSRQRSTGGSGLGLYIARDLVQRQGGSLTLMNRSEGGLRATVLLPAR